MRVEDFRKEEGLRAELATFLRSPTGMIVLSVLREMGRPMDVPATADALASARILAQYHGYCTCSDDLERMATPIADLSPLPEPQFGANVEIGDQLPSQMNYKLMQEMIDARNAARNATADAAAARSVRDPAS